VDDLETAARDFRAALTDPAELHTAPARFERFLEAYRASDEPRQQVLDPVDARVIEAGSAPTRPAMWSTKKLRPDQAHPWVTSNGRWIVAELAPQTWRLERRFGGRWSQDVDRSWRVDTEPVLTRCPATFRTQWDALWLGRMGFEVVDAGGQIPPEGNVVIDLGEPTATYDEQVRDAFAGTIVDASTPLWQLVPWFGFSAVGVRAVRRFAAGADPASIRTLATGDTAVAAVASSAGKAAALTTGSALGAVPFAIVGAWTAQAAVATRRTWREAAERERDLRARLSMLPPG
jgi:hypothetical protein